MKHFKYKTIALFTNLIIKEVIKTADDWTEATHNKAKPEDASYAASRIQYKARKELIQYLTRSYGDLS